MGQELQQAIAVLSQSDPLTKLLLEVRLGRMKPTDPGLRAITETWLATYRRVLESGKSFDRRALLRLDPGPRLDVLIEAGMAAADHPAVEGLLATFQRMLAGAQEGGAGCGSLPP